MNPSRQQTHKQTRRHNMTDLINKLSKIDQRSVQLAILHANNGNYRAIDSMIRGWLCIGNLQTSLGWFLRYLPILTNLLRDPVVGELISRHPSLMAKLQIGRSLAKSLQRAITSR